MALEKHKVTLTKDQWEKLQQLSEMRHISVSACIREIVEDALKFYVRKEKTT